MEMKYYFTIFVLCCCLASDEFSPYGKNFHSLSETTKETHLLFFLHSNLFPYLMFLQQTHVSRALHKNSATNFTMIEHRNSCKNEQYCS